MPTEDLKRIEVSRDQVPQALRDAAFMALWDVARSLKLSPFPSLRFLPADRWADRGGVDPAEPSTLWVRVQHSKADMVETTAHELKHAEQLMRFGDFTGTTPDSPCSMPQREMAATAYGLEIRRRFEAGRPLVDNLPAFRSAREVVQPRPDPSTSSGGAPRGYRRCSRCTSVYSITLTHRCRQAGSPSPAVRRA